MAGVRKTNTRRSLSHGIRSRRIPRRGQVTASILVGIAHSVASIFHLGGRRAACQLL